MFLLILSYYARIKRYSLFLFVWFQPIDSLPKLIGPKSRLCPDFHLNFFSSILKKKYKCYISNDIKWKRVVYSTALVNKCSLQCISVDYTSMNLNRSGWSGMSTRRRLALISSYSYSTRKFCIT